MAHTATFDPLSARDVNSCHDDYSASYRKNHQEWPRCFWKRRNLL